MNTLCQKNFKSRQINKSHLDTVISTKNNAIGSITPIVLSNNQRKHKQDSSAHMYQTPIWNILYFLSPQSLTKGDNRYYESSAQAHLLAQWKFWAKRCWQQHPNHLLFWFVGAVQHTISSLQPLQAFSTYNYWNVNLWSVKGFRFLTDSLGVFHFINTAWFNKQEIRKLF